MGAMMEVEDEHVKQLKDIFDRFDMDSDGSLTPLELAALLRSLGLRPTGDQLHIMQATMDSNANGSIEFEELLQALMMNEDDLEEVEEEEVMVSQKEGQLLEVFTIFDRDGNGVITPAELAGAMAKMGSPLSFRELTEMIKEADKNEDGVINFSEFAYIMAKSSAHFLGLPLSP